MKNYKVFLFFLVISFSSSIFAKENSHSFKVSVIAEGLDHPWSLVFISDDEFLVTEKTGKIRIIKNGRLLDETLKNVPNSLFAGQGGLSDIVLHPEFSNNRTIFLSFSEIHPSNKRLSTLTVVKAKLNGYALEDVEEIFKADPYRTAPAHFGARLLFLKDGSLLITSGDGFNFREKAQDLDNHFGKVIRINNDGSIPDDNPYANGNITKRSIYTYGHRNQQGLTLSLDNSQVYLIEHGPRGGDELNILEPSNNYGWPLITYGIDYSGATISPFKEMEGLEQPIKYWVPSIAPSGMTTYRGDKFPNWKGDIFISSMIPGELRRLKISKEGVEEEVLIDNLGRLRGVHNSPDGNLLIISDRSNAKIYKISPK